MTVLLDSVILIDYLNAQPAARTYVESHYASAEAAISVVTMAEVLVGIDAAGLPDAIAYLDAFPLLGIDRETAIAAGRQSLPTTARPTGRAARPVARTSVRSSSGPPSAASSKR